MRAALVQFKEAYEDVKWTSTVGLSAGSTAILYTVMRVWNRFKPLLAFSSPGAWSLWFGAGLLFTLALRPLTHWCFQIPTSDHNRYAEALALSIALPAVLPLAPISPLWASGLYICSVATTIALAARRLLTPKSPEQIIALGTSSFALQRIVDFLTYPEKRLFSIEREGTIYIFEVCKHPKDPFVFQIRFITPPKTCWPLVRELEHKDKLGQPLRINGAGQFTLDGLSKVIAESPVIPRSDFFLLRREPPDRISIERKKGGSIQLGDFIREELIDALRSSAPTEVFVIDGKSYAPWATETPELPPPPSEPKTPAPPRRASDAASHLQTGGPSADAADIPSRDTP